MSSGAISSDRRRQHPAVSVATALILWLFTASTACAEDVDFLIPGVSLESVELTAGTSVEYLIISEAYQVLDTSMVGLSVIDAGEGLLTLEIMSAPFPPVEEETVTVRLVVESDIAASSTPEEVESKISRILIRDADSGFREPTGEEIEDFDPGRLFMRADSTAERRSLGMLSCSVPAGEFTCEASEYIKRDLRKVLLGGVEADKYSEEKSTLYISGRVPFWGLVKSVVRRESSTRLASTRIEGKKRPKVTVTESVLISFTSPSAD